MQFNTNQKINIIISNKVKNRLSIPNLWKDTVLFEYDPIHKAIEYLRQASTRDMYTLFFLSSQELPSLTHVLEKSFQTKFYYSIVALGTKNTTQIHPAYLPFLSDYRTTPIQETEFIFLVEKALNTFQKQKEENFGSSETYTDFLDAWNDQESLIRIGRALSMERDQDKLLRLILYLSKKITGADAGSIFCVEETEGGEKQLRFKPV